MRPTVVHVLLRVVRLDLTVVSLGTDRVLDPFELFVSDGLHVRDDGPLDAFLARRRRQRPIVVPIRAEIHSLQEVEHADGADCVTILRLVEDVEDRVEEVALFSATLVEENPDHRAQHVIRPLIRVQDVELCVEILTVDRVLTRGM